MRAEVDSVSSMRAVDRNMQEAEDSVECGTHWAVEGQLLSDKVPGALGSGGVLLSDEFVH